MTDQRPDARVGAHAHSSKHRAEIEASLVCGCFCCLKTFSPSAISEWITEPQDAGQTAICPECGVDSVIGDASGYPVEATFLKAMRLHWFDE